MQTFFAATRAQLRLSARALATWGWIGFGLVLTAWGTLLDVLAVGVDTGRPQAIAHASGVMGGLLLGAWSGSRSPSRHCLNEGAAAWEALPSAAWAVPSARATVAAVMGALGSALCMLYTLVLSHQLSLPTFALAVLGAAAAGFLAAAWAAFLSARLGSLAAIALVLGLSSLPLVALPATLRPLLPSSLASTPMGGMSLLAGVLAATGLLSLTPRSPRADGRAGPAR